MAFAHEALQQIAAIVQQTLQLQGITPGREQRATGVGGVHHGASWRVLAEKCVRRVKEFGGVDGGWAELARVC